LERTSVGTWRPRDPEGPIKRRRRSYSITAGLEEFILAEVADGPKTAKFLREEWGKNKPLTINAKIAELVDRGLIQRALVSRRALGLSPHAIYFMEADREKLFPS
jgi:predicted HTH transcriptional regulator